MNRSQRVSLDEVKLPEAQDAEKFVLAGILQSADPAEYYSRVAELVDASSFLDNRHRAIFAAMGELHESGAALSYSTIFLHLQRSSPDSGISLTFISDLQENSPRLNAIETHCCFISEAARARKTLVLLNDAELRIIARDPVDEIVAETTKALQGLESHLSDAGSDPVQIVERAGGLGVFMSPLQNDGAIATPWYKLNDATDGLQGGQVWVCGGLPGTGKTASGLNIAATAMFNKHAVLIESREMTKEALLRGMICTEAAVDSQAARSGRLSAQERNRVTAALQKFEDHKQFLEIRDSGNTTASAISKRLRQRKVAGRPVNLVIIDFLQLLRGIGRFENRTKELDQITYSLKDIAKDFDTTVLVLSQLNIRKPDEWMKRAPQLGDFRDSGAIEQVADVAIILRLHDAEQQFKSLRNVDLFLLKQREGRTGKIPLVFSAPVRRFDEPGDEMRIVA